MTEAQLKTFLALLMRSDLQGHLDVTVSELARTTGLGRPAVRGALNWLASPATTDGESFDPYIIRDGESIAIPKFVSGEAFDKKFTLSADEDPDKRVKLLEEEVTRLCRQIERMKAGDESDLADTLPDDESAKAVRDIEYTLGRALLSKEIFYLGQMIDRFGPKSVVREVRNAKRRPDPLRAAYGKLNGVTKQTKGSFKRRDVPQDRVVKYTDAPEETSIWEQMD